MKNKKNGYSIDRMTPSERERRIHELETERLQVVRELERKMHEAARISGQSAYAKRTAAVGRASNDYRPIK